MKIDENEISVIMESSIVEHLENLVKIGKIDKSYSVKEVHCKNSMNNFVIELQNGKRYSVSVDMWSEDV